MTAEKKRKTVIRSTAAGAGVAALLYVILTYIFGQPAEPLIFLAFALIGGLLFGLLAFLTIPVFEANWVTPQPLESGPTGSENSPKLPAMGDLWQSTEDWRLDQALAFRREIVTQIGIQYGKPLYSAIIAVPDSIRQSQDRFDEIIAWLNADGWSCRHDWRLTSKGAVYDLNISKTPPALNHALLPAATITRNQSSGRAE